MTDSSFYGQDGISDGTSDFHAHAFLIRQELGKVNVMMPVKVVSVSGGGVSANPPTVNVQPVVNMIDGIGKATPHGTVFGIRAPRPQSGNGAIINDPMPGDLGWIVCSHRDISAALAAGKVANPGSRRRFSLSDSFYTGSVWGGTNAPAQYFQFTSDGFAIVDKNGNSIRSSAAGLNLNGVVITPEGKITAPLDIIAGTISLQQHVHGDVQTGGDQTGAPVA